MQYGYFNDVSKEYIITNPKTPVKWINYIGNLSFGGYVDQTGGALLCKGDPALNRILKYIPQQPASEFKGETMYIKIKGSESYTVVSPYYVPTLDNYTRYECHVGLGYSRIISEFYGIESDITIFVPLDGQREIRDIKITNLRNSKVEVDIIPLVEYTHFDALKQFTNCDWVPQTMQSKVINENNGCKILTQYAFMNKDNKVNYFTSNIPVSSYETDRKRFLGDNEYGTFESPLSLRSDELSNFEALRGDNIGALMHHIGGLDPGRSKRIILQLGQTEKITNEMENINRYRNEGEVDKEFQKLKIFWENYLDKLQVETPDKMMNTQINIYNPRQCHITKNWSRSLSMYQMGFGERGIGIRDLSQDIMGILSNSADEGREALEVLLSMQKIDGSAMHQFNPLNCEGSYGDAMEMEDRPNYYSDDHLWVVLAVLSYLKETGDFSFLDKVVPYYEKDKFDKPIKVGTVRNHLDSAIEFTWKKVGIHGLPLLGFADWADPVNLPSGAESIFVASLFGKVVFEFMKLITYLGHHNEVVKYKNYYEIMKERVNEFAWDGKWFISYFDEKGKPLGSKNNEHGKIYAHVQPWTIISGFANKEKAMEVLHSVNEILYTPYGIKLSHPGYDGYDETKGGITTYPPGTKENGGIFLHCNPWVIIAETICGNGDRAYKYYDTINPISKNNRMEIYESEPYCYPQNILGSEHPQFGLARNSWLSGTASWAYQAATQYILGIRADYHGLIIDPCIPKHWDGYKVKKIFRGSIYNIEVRNPNHISKGVKEIVVDGIRIEGSLVHFNKVGKDYHITVYMDK